MIGADLGPPMPLDDWSNHIAAALADHGLPHVHAELHYASWASIGNVARRCGELAPSWKRYADDVVQQLHLNV